MNFLYGRNGTPVGTRDGKWLFDELGKTIGSIHENYVFSPGGHGMVGRFLGDILYDNSGAPRAVGEHPKLRMLSPLPPRMAPLPERLVPLGASVVDAGPVRLPEPFDKLNLAESLQDFGGSR